ncbi:hypothetical protein [Clostridium botulinum]|uniref:hypothetical protein n=1 Tax=Clostridium botulinum TaxID=1491 RepID=UPI000D1313AD|nr:hypothetical protein [Clostridium botulinum]AVQ47462.1 hypothetical protein C7M60_17485 [Clostridium botulinum]AVQ50830.1 hypothetical protein C7M58_16475 [Clostridium botulinum]
MENRFFDINSNIYLNCIYMLSILSKSNETISIKRLLISLYLIKKPIVCIKFLKRSSKSTFLKHVEPFELDNIQTEMDKYSSKLFITGFNEALLFLISNDIVSYAPDSINLIKANKFKNLKLKILPEDLIYKAKYVNKIVESYSESELEIKLMNYGEKNYE